MREINGGILVKGVKNVLDDLQYSSPNHSNLELRSPTKFDLSPLTHPKSLPTLIKPRLTIGEHENANTLSIERAGLISNSDELLNPPKEKMTPKKTNANKPTG
jgi:hypothetical protein